MLFTSYNEEFNNYYHSGKFVCGASGAVLISSESSMTSASLVSLAMLVVLVILAFGIVLTHRKLIIHIDSKKFIDIIIQGNIGVGKSTVVNILRSTGKYDIIDEPVSTWSNLGVLSKFYQDPKSMAYSFQTLTFISRLMNYCEDRKNKIRILERDIEADKICFAEQMYKSKFITEIEWTIYNYIYEKWSSLVNKLSKNSVAKKIVVYLRSSPEECFERINSRNRNGESKITLNYLKELHETHEKWLLGKDNVYVINIKHWDNPDEYKKYIIGIFEEYIKNN